MSCTAIREISFLKELQHPNIVSLENKLREADDKLKKANNRYDLILKVYENIILIQTLSIMDQQQNKNKLATGYSLADYEKIEKIGEGILIKPISRDCKQYPPAIMECLILFCEK